MQIVIDIPEEIKAVIDKNGTNEIVTETVWQAVRKGTPLPKVHGDLIAEKERLIKKDIESIENRVRHAFNQGYEMGLKESRSENPNTCGDAVSRQAVMEHYSTGEIAHCHHVSRNNLLDFIEQLPSVTPQQRTGHWIIIDDCEQFIAKCSECGRIEDSRMISKYLYCHCGARMEVEE